MALVLNLRAFKNKKYTTRNPFQENYSNNKIPTRKRRVRNCPFLVANATKNFALATRISQLVTSGQLTISCHDNCTNNNFDFQPNRLK